MDRLSLASSGGRRARRRGVAGSATLLASVAIALALLVGPPPGRAAGHIVQAINFRYVAPEGGSSLTVTAGDQVTWQAAGDPHTVTSGTPGVIDDRFVDSPASAGLLLDGDSFTTTFPSGGTYPYFCEIHPEQMSGTVIVVAAVTPAPTKAPTAAPTPRPTPGPTPPPTAPPTAQPSPAAASAPPAASPSPGSSTPASPPVTTAPSGTPIGSPTAATTAAPSGEFGAAAGGPGLLPLALGGLLLVGVAGGVLAARRRGGAGG